MDFVHIKKHKMHLIRRNIVRNQKKITTFAPAFTN